MRKPSVYKGFRICLYTNWLNYYVYQITPYDLDGTPDFTKGFTRD